MACQWHVLHDMSHYIVYVALLERLRPGFGVLDLHVLSGARPHFLVSQGEGWFQAHLEPFRPQPLLQEAPGPFLEEQCVEDR